MVLEADTRGGLVEQRCGGLTLEEYKFELALVEIWGVWSRLFSGKHWSDCVYIIGIVHYCIILREKQSPEGLCFKVTLNSK